MLSLNRALKGLAGLAAACFAQSGLAASVGSAFTYQGRLTDNGVAANGAYDVVFQLWDAPVGGTQAGSNITLNDLPVQDGLFSTKLDFGAASLNGSARWLAVSVRPGASSGAYYGLGPRQELTPAPYAMGVALPWSATFSSASPLISIAQTGTGNAAGFSISNAASNATALSANTNGNGYALYAYSSGSDGLPVIFGYNNSQHGAAGHFRCESVLNPDPAIKAEGSSGYGVFTTSTNGTAAKVSITNPGNTSPALVVSTESTGKIADLTQFNSNATSSALHVKNYGKGAAAQFSTLSNTSTEPAVLVTSLGQGPALEVLGTARVTVLEIVGGSDLSEGFDISGEDIKPGMVVAIDPNNPGRLTLASHAYDAKVAGVVSGAGGVATGMVMSQSGTLAEGKHPVALTGRVYCYVDATNGAIQPGDLLTTSGTPGHAMKVGDAAKAHGAVIGKAMTALDGGKGLVLVLVNLQ